MRRPPSSTLFPHTPLFRSIDGAGDRHALELGWDGHVVSIALDPSIDRKSTRLNSSHSQISSTPVFFLNDAAPPELYPLPPHAALPIYRRRRSPARPRARVGRARRLDRARSLDRSEEHTSELQSQSNLLYPRLFFKRCGAPRALPSSPTRRSSDLSAAPEPGTPSSSGGTGTSSRSRSIPR